MVEAQICAGIDFFGKTLYYAEAERFSGQHRLLRLGSCDFDFDASEVLLGKASSAHLKTLGEALADVFVDSAASTLHVVLHPPVCASFFAPVPAGMDEEARHQHLLREASLLVPARGAADALRLTTDVLYEEAVAGAEALEWNHVLVMNRQVHSRFDQLMERLPQATYRWCLSTQTAAYAVDHMGWADASSLRGPYTLAVGQYPGHTEYACCCDGQWRFGSQARVETDADQAYFALSTLGQMGLTPADVGRVLVYGQPRQDTGTAALEQVMGVRPTAFQLRDLVDLNPESLVTAFDPSAYVPCLGAAL